MRRRTNICIDTLLFVLYDRERERDLLVDGGKALLPPPKESGRGVRPCILDPCIEA